MTLPDQTALNIRERAGRRKQKPVRSPESSSKRIRCLFGIQGRPEHPRGLEGPSRLALQFYCVLGGLIVLLASGVGVLKVFPGVAAPDR